MHKWQVGLMLKDKFHQCDSIKQFKLQVTGGQVNLTESGSGVIWKFQVFFNAEVGLMLKGDTNVIEY